MSEDPFEAMERRMAVLERRMQEMLEEAFQPTWSLVDRALEPLFHVEESEREVIVTVDLPCVRDKSDLEVECTGTTLEIAARMCQPMSFRKWGTVQKDADFDCYRKVIRLPTEVDSDRAQASLKEGMLTIHLPKRMRRQKVKVS